MPVACLFMRSMMLQRAKSFGLVRLTTLCGFYPRLSPDGQWLLTSNYVLNAVLLSNAKTGDVIQTLPSGSENWLSANRFQIYRKNDRQIWDLKEGHAVLQKQITKEFSNPSPDKKWALKQVLEGPLPKPSQPQDLPLEHHEIISTSDGKTLHRLPGDHWRAFFWTKNNAEFWGGVRTATRRGNRDPRAFGATSAHRIGSVRK